VTRFIFSEKILTANRVNRNLVHHFSADACAIQYD